MRQKLPTPVKLVVLLTLMPICGIVALILVVFLLMGIGLWLEDNCWPARCPARRPAA